MPTDLNGMDLSKLLVRQISRVLSKKGYKLKEEDFLSEIPKDESFSPLKIKPSTLARSISADADGLLQIHVTFHFGINPTERSSNEGPFSQIHLNASARLIDKNGPREVWQKSGRARSLNSADFHNRLNYAVFTLANGLFENFPDKK